MYMYNFSIFISSFTYYPFEYYLLLFAGPSIHSITGGTGRLGLINRKETSEMRTVHPFALLQCSAVQPFSTDTNCKHKTKDQQPSAIAPPILVTAPSNLQIHQPQVDITIYNITYQPIRVSGICLALNRTMKIMKRLSLINSSIILITCETKQVQY